MFYVICYDIVEDNRRQRIAKLLSTYGMRVQQSVFEVVLQEKEYEQLQRRLHKLLDRGEDQVRFYPLSGHCRKNVTVLGLQPPFAIDDPAIIV
jgi:CRISPR-associated protein Cas2